MVGIREEFTVEFNELNSKEIEEGLRSVYIIKDGKTEEYEVIDTREKLLEYLEGYTDIGERKKRILVTFECINICGIFENVIFLERFKIDSYSKPKLDDSLYLSFTNCEFFSDIELLGGDYKRIKINESTIQKNIFIRFINCEKSRINNVVFKEDVIFENSEIGTLNINTSQIMDNLLFQKVTIFNDFIMDKVMSNKDLDFVDCMFEGLSKLQLSVNGELNFLQCSFYKKSEIDFDELNGKISLYKTNFSDKCYLEYELLTNKEYKPLIFEDNYKKTKWNFLIVSDIYKSSGRTEQFLTTFFYFKKYERLEKKNKGTYRFTLLDYLIGITTKYYTSWERTLLTMGVIIVAFFMLYCCFPNLLVCKDAPMSSKNLFETVFEMFKNSNFDIHFLISKFGNTLYFTIITFTTVGYGDITPLNWMKLIVSLESFLGVFYTSSLVVALSRRFL
ncbi:potassium channel family protein [Clostridium saccharoperbutylacetonicum]